MNGDRYFSAYKTEPTSCKLLSKINAAQSNTYVLNATSNAIGNNFAVALSSCTIQVYTPNADLLCVFAHDKEVSGVKFSCKDASLLLSSSLDGKLNVWDVRCQKSVQTFVDNSEGVLKPLTCFDYNLDEMFICAGTELIREDSFLLFWDRRSSEVLGGYWNSHTDDITQVQFHPQESPGMASSSTDGLINIFNLNEASEDDALSSTLNVGSGIAKFCWRDLEHLSCTTSLEEYQLWSATEASPGFSTSREDMTKNNQIQVDYFIDSLQIGKSWYLATGSYDGTMHLWHSKKHGLKPKYLLPKGHSDVVRSISYNIKEEIIITGGEDGIVCQWKLPVS